MITPRRTRLVRVAELQTFRQVLTALALAPDVSVADRLVVVPTRGAARQLARGRPEAVWPDLVTRDQLYDRLGQRLDPPPARLTPFAREAAIRTASNRAAGEGAPPPFELRPGLVAEMLRFYDQLRRQRQSVMRFEELLVDSLSGNPDDRGAERMLRQTRFLAATFRAYEARFAASEWLDEHALRERLVASPAPHPVRHVVVSVADWIADADGLFPADFDLLTRLPGLESIDVVSTTGTLASGFHQRIHDWLPGIEEADGAAMGVQPSALPVLVVPGGDDTGPAFVVRDREEELVAVARLVKADPTLLPAVMTFKKPLPYLYLAPEVFGSAGLKFEAQDALPLAAEPYTAAVDVVVDFVLSAFARGPAAALLRSPHFDWAAVGMGDVGHGAIAALDKLLSQSHYLGEIDRLRALSGQWQSADAGTAKLVEAAKPAFRVMLAGAEELVPLTVPAPLSVQVSRLGAFLDRRARVLDERHERARTAIAALLDALKAAYAAHGDPAVTMEGLGPELRRWIEEETFVPDGVEANLQLVDAQAARYADPSSLFVVGLVEGEWPERSRRNIFYPPGLLAALGWPSEADRRGAELAAFVDLLRSPRHQTRLSTIELEEEALVEPATLIDEAATAGLEAVPAAAPPPDRVFDDEMLSLEPPLTDRLSGISLAWATLRMGRTPASDAGYHGETGPRPSAPVSVSAVETYLTCPFKYYARHVLRLEDEPDDEEVMDPKRQGQFVHAVFEDFFRRWDAERGGAITAETLSEAQRLFERVAEPHLARLPQAEAGLERTRLLGSPVAPGLGDAVFRMEAERPVPVVRRELELPLKGVFVFDGRDGPRRLALRGVADRVDLLADGTFRLIDYKLSKAPNRSRALQLPIYAICTEQKLGGRWRLGEAAYIAFKEPRRVVPLFTARSDRDDVLAAASARLIAAVDAVEAGHFPPTPEDVFLCSFCAYTAVCRKDYVGV